MDPRRQGLLVITKMALQDGVVAAEELETLGDMGGGLTDGEVAELIREARERPLNSLLEGIERYADRFVIALRAFHMAHSDNSFDLEEELGFELLVERFGISSEDCELIKAVYSGMTGDSPVVDSARLLELHRDSSFHGGGL